MYLKYLIGIIAGLSAALCPISATASPTAQTNAQNDGVPRIINSTPTTTNQLVNLDSDNTVVEGTSQPDGLVNDWLDVVRQSPYQITKGFYKNISIIRRWVLLEEGFCENKDRHILFNRRGHFLGYLDNLTAPEQNQQALNQLRKKLFEEGRVSLWAEGTLDRTGYPFALACNQPHANIYASLDRMLGKNQEDLVWGTWDGMTIGSKDAPLPLAKVVLGVYDQRSLQTGTTWSNIVVHHLLGQILIESGARKLSFSSASAIGLLQLRPEVLNDCQTPPSFYLHRMAQIDCALKLYRQNHRNLLPAFANRFDQLPEAKKETLYAMLLVQAYHGGIGRILTLLGDGIPGKAARYYADHHNNFAAEDIALGMIFHNMGRQQLGMASLYYLIDVEVATEALCKTDPTLTADVC